MTEVLIHAKGQRLLLRLPVSSPAAAIYQARQLAPGCEVVNVRRRVRRINRGGSLPGAGDRVGSYYRPMAAVAA